MPIMLATYSTNEVIVSDNDVLAKKEKESNKVTFGDHAIRLAIGENAMLHAHWDTSPLCVL